MKGLFKDKEKEELKAEIQRLRRILSLQKQKEEYDSIHMIPIDRICLDSVRTDEEDADDEFIHLMESIRIHGLIQPILLKRISIDMSDETGLFTLVSGSRRVKALKLLGEKRIKSIILPNDVENLSKLTFIENYHRQYYDIFETYEIIKGIYSSSQNDFQGTADSLCISKKMLKNILDLEKIDDDEREMCRRYKLSNHQILCISKIDDHSSRKIAIRHIGSKGLSRRQTEEYLYDLIGMESLAEIIEPSKKKMILKDIRLFYNTIDRTIDSFEESGLPIECIKEEHQEGFKIIINIKKRTSNQNISPISSISS